MTFYLNNVINFVIDSALAHLQLDQSTEIAAFFGIKFIPLIFSTMANSGDSQPSALARTLIDYNDSNDELRALMELENVNLNQNPLDNNQQSFEEDDYKQPTNRVRLFHNNNDNNFTDDENDANSISNDRQRIFDNHIRTTHISISDLQRHQSNSGCDLAVMASNQNQPRDQIEAEWQPVAMIDTDFGESENDFPNPNYCFLCEYTALRHSNHKNMAVFYLLKFVEEQSHMMAEKEWTFFVQKFYESHCMQYTKFKLPWMRKQIYAHFDEHAPTSFFMHENSLKVYNNVMRILRDGSIFLKNQQTNKFDINEKALNIYMRTDRSRAIVLSKLLLSRRNEVL